jgi:hypothetical protein
VRATYAGHVSIPLPLRDELHPPIDVQNAFLVDGRPRPELLRQQPEVPPALGNDLRVGDERLVGEVGRSQPLMTGERMTRRHRDDAWLFEERNNIESPDPEELIESAEVVRTVDELEIDFARGDRVPHLQEIQRPYVDPQRQLAPGQLADGGRDLVPWRAHASDGEPASGLTGDGSGLRECVIGRPDDLAGLPCERLAGRGELHGPRAAREQQRSHFTLEAANLSAHRRRRDVHPLGCPGEVPILGKGHKVPQLAYLHVPKITRSGHGVERRCGGGSN